MRQVNIGEVETNFSKICSLLESGKEDYVLVIKDNLPYLRITFEDRDQKDIETYNDLNDNLIDQEMLEMFEKISNGVKSTTQM